MRKNKEITINHKGIRMVEGWRKLIWSTKAELEKFRLTFSDLFNMQNRVFVYQRKVTKERRTVYGLFKGEIPAWKIYWEYGKSLGKNLAAIENIYCFCIVMVIYPF